MTLQTTINPVVRAVLVIAAVATLVTGVTFAAFSSQATLTNNTLSTTSADLRIDNSDDASCSPETNTATGFAFNGTLAPGTSSSVHSFCLLNAGGVHLDVTVYATNSVVTGSIDDSKVHFCFTRITAPASAEQCFTRAEMLVNLNALPGSPITAENPDQEVEYDVFVKVDANHGGSGFSVAPFNLVFDGTQSP